MKLSNENLCTKLALLKNKLKPTNKLFISFKSFKNKD